MRDPRGIGGERRRGCVGVPGEQPRPPVVTPLWKPVASAGAVSVLHRPPHAVAVSTLAVAGLFGPLRHRVQAFIDRRFYRSKYDAEQIIATFSTRLRDEVDLTALNAELVDAVNATVRPAAASLWLRP
ncbi:hypothetical protein BH23ACT10_BH23ACT10_15140 [soil metagenome]